MNIELDGSAARPEKSTQSASNHQENKGKEQQAPAELPQLALFPLPFIWLFSLLVFPSLTSPLKSPLPHLPPLLSSPLPSLTPPPLPSVMVPLSSSR